MSAMEQMAINILKGMIGEEQLKSVMEVGAGVVQMVQEIHTLTVSINERLKVLEANTVSTVDPSFGERMAFDIGIIHDKAPLEVLMKGEIDDDNGSSDGSGNANGIGSYYSGGNDRERDT